MKRTKKALASLAIAGMALTMVPFNAFAEGTFPTRLAGWTAVQTAVVIADQTGWTGTAVLSSSTSYGMVDALTSGPLAKFIKAPILLQGAENILDVDTKAELIKLNITKVYVTSGTAVISQGVIDELRGMNITVESLGGFDRFDTSVNIGQKLVDLGATVSKAAVVYGWLNPDALSIASIASAQTEPILLTERDSIPASVKAFLTTNTSVTTTDVIGGTAVISDAVKAQLPSATRVAGITAYDTNLAVLKAFDSVLKYDHVFIANGETAIDALTGAPLAAQYNAGIVLTNGTANEGMTYVMSKLSSTSVVTAFGGTAVVPDSVLAGVKVPVGGGGGGGSNSGSDTATELDTVMTDFTSVFNALGVLDGRFSLAYDEDSRSGILTIGESMKERPISAMYTTVVDKVRDGEITAVQMDRLMTKLNEIEFNGIPFSEYVSNKLDGRLHSAAAIDYLDVRSPETFNALVTALADIDQYTELVDILSDLSLIQGDKVIPQPTVEGQTLLKIHYDADSNHSGVNGTIITGNTYTVAEVKTQLGIAQDTDIDNVTFNELSGKYIGLEFSDQTHWFKVQ